MSGSGLCALLQPVRVGFVTDALQGKADIMRAHLLPIVRSFSLKQLVHVPTIYIGVRNPATLTRLFPRVRTTA
eukprot:scaffold17054_cov148-Isochrysis_galbana.AAC.1